MSTKITKTKRVLALMLAVALAFAFGAGVPTASAQYQGPNPDPTPTPTTYPGGNPGGGTTPVYVEPLPYGGPFSLTGGAGGEAGGTTAETTGPVSAGAGAFGFGDTPLTVGGLPAGADPSLLTGDAAGSTLAGPFGDGVVGGTGGAGGELVHTGASSTSMAVAGLALVTSGSAALVAARRRK